VERLRVSQREIARKEEEERRLAEAEALEQEGRPEEAEEILSEPITYVTPARNGRGELRARRKIENQDR